MSQSRSVTVDPRWVRNPSDELAIEQGCYFDEEAGRLPCDFIEAFCRQSKGRWAGQPLTLLDWQRDFLMRLFGWKRPDGLRRFRRAYLEVAKKNGKSTLISGLALFLLIADGEGAPEIYVNAVDREQASIIYDEASRMVRASPSLSRRLDPIDSKKRITDPVGNGKIQANSADVPNKDGVNAHGILFDELHRQKDRGLWDIFEYAAEAREQPLTISITTAGEDAEGVWYEQREYSEKINAGEIPDTSHLGVVYRALETDDLDDPATWRKANPSLGATLKDEDFARGLEEAKRKGAAALANFLRLRLNIIARSEGRYVSPEEWAACSGPVSPLDGRCWWGGLDLASTNDLAALAALSQGEDGTPEATLRFWLPEANIARLENEHGVPYRQWAKQGLITLTPGNVIDYGFIRAEIKALAERGELRKLLIDPYNAQKLALELKEEDGLPVEFIRQGFLSLSAPTKELHRLVVSGRLRHGGNPILKWHASNAIAEQDAAGNWKLSKAKSKKKIDGMAALVNAVAASDGDIGERSVYEERGLLIL